MIKDTLLQELATKQSALEWLRTAMPDSNTNHNSTDRISGRFLFYHDYRV